MPAGRASIPVKIGRRLLGGRQINHLVRFEPVLELVGQIQGDRPRLLDVGSGSLGIARLLGSRWHVTSLDADFEDYGAALVKPRTGAGQVLGDVRALRFEDHAYDAVVAVDLLEHVGPDDRVRALHEICRVARRRAIVACPAGDEALAADHRLEQRLRAGGRDVPAWLTGHLENGFPRVEEIVAAMEPFGTVRVLGNESISAHERLVWAELSPLPAAVLRLLCKPLEGLLASGRGRARVAARTVLRALRGWDRAPVYRVVVSLDNQVSPPAAGLEDHSSE